MAWSTRTMYKNVQKPGRPNENMANVAAVVDA